MAKTNYHNHTYLCRHAKGMPLDYIKKAVELGYEEIGISDHGPLFGHPHIRMSMDEFYDIYLSDIEKAKEQFGEKIKIYRGLEIEYLPNQEAHYEELLKNLDYLILGQHILYHDCRLFDTFREMNAEFLNIYRDTVIKAMESGYFRILAHPDIYLFSYQTWNERTEAVARDIIEAAIITGTFLEINANGIRRRRIINQDGEEVYIYPRIEFWRLLKEYPEAKIIIGEDNHSPDYIGDKAVLRAWEFAEKLSLKIREHLFDD